MEVPSESPLLKQESSSSTRTYARGSTYCPRQIMGVGKAETTSRVFTKNTKHTVVCPPAKRREEKPSIVMFMKNGTVLLGDFSFTKKHRPQNLPVRESLVIIHQGISVPHLILGDADDRLCAARFRNRNHLDHRFQFVLRHKLQHLEHLRP